MVIVNGAVLLSMTLKAVGRIHRLLNRDPDRGHAALVVVFLIFISEQTSQYLLSAMCCANYKDTLKSEVLH